jgi:hypothetical protein
MMKWRQRGLQIPIRTQGPEHQHITIEMLIEQKDVDQTRSKALTEMEVAPVPSMM